MPIGSKPILQEADKELKSKSSGVLSNTQERFGVARAKRQRKAIMLSKSRKSGANIPFKGA